MMIFAAWHSEEACTVLTADSERIVRAATSMTLTELANVVTATDTLIVTIPGEYCLTYTLTLPTKEWSLALKALPGLLEDRLLADIQTLHFAILAEQDNTFTVAVIEKKRLEQILSLFTAVGLTPTSILPDYTLLATPLKANEYTQLLWDQRMLVKTAGQKGFTLPNDLARSEIDHWLTTHHLMPSSLPANNALTSSDFLTYCWKQSANWPTKNLLQGKYATKKRREVSHFWRICRHLAWIWLGLGTLGVAAQGLYFHHELTKTNLAIATLYHQFFPAATSVVNPELRIKQVLGNVSQDPFLTQSALLAEILHEETAVTIQRLQYNQHQLIATVNATSSDPIETIVQHLSDQGLHVTRTLTEKTNGVVAEIMITAA